MRTRIFHQQTLSNFAAKASIFMVFIIGTLILVESITGLSLLNAFFSQDTPMKLMAAILLVLSSLSLWVFLRQGPWNNHVLKITGGFIILVSFLTLLTYQWGNVTNFHDYLLFSFFLQPHNRMALITTLIFLLLGVIFVLLSNNSRTQDRIAHILFFPSASLSYFVLSSFVLDVSEIFRVEGINISPLTAFSLFLLCIVVLFLRPDTWLMRILSGPGPGSMMSRRLLPWLLILPIVIAWVRIKAHQQDYLPAEIGAILVAITNTLSFLLLVWWSAWSVNRLDESRRKAEEEKKRSEQDYGITLASISDAVIATDENDRITLMNKEAERLTGWRFEEAVTQPVNAVLKLINPMTGHESEELTTIVKNRGTGVRQPEGSLLLSRDGRKISINNSGAPIVTDNGRMVGIVIVFRDVTESEKAQDALRESKARLNALITATSDGVYRMSPDWKQMVSMEGRNFLTSVDTPVDDWLNNFIPRDSQPLVLETIHKAIATKSKFELEHNVIRQDGSIGWTLSRAIPVLDKSGEIVEWLGIAHDFTDRWKAEKALRKSEQRMKALIKATSNAIYRMSPNWDTLYILSGDFFNEAENQPYKPEEYIPADSLPKALETISKAIKNKSLFELEHQVYFPDRSIGWTLSRAIPLLNDKGEIDEWFGFAEDITLRKKAEQALQQSEELFSKAFHHIPVPAIITRVSDNIMTNVNSKFLELFEYSHNEVIGHTTKELHLFTDYEQRMKALENLFKAGYLQDHEFEMITKSGKKLTLLLSSVFVTIREERHVLTTYIDITERKETERQMGQLSAIIKHSALSIISIDLNGMIQTWNEGAEKIYGYRAVEVTGKNISIIIPPNEQDITEIIPQILQDGKIENFETHRLRKDGTIITVLVTLSPIRNASGEIVAISSISDDISELKKVEEALRAKERDEDMRKGAEKALFKLNEELTRSNLELQQFAYLASHDLQEPLRKISTFTQFLAQRYKGHFDKEGEQFIHYIVENAHQMKVLVNDLLTYSMIGSRMSPFTEVDFNQLMEKVVQSHELIIQKKNAVITYDVLPSVLGDEVQLFQLLLHLVDNSLKFCNETPVVAVSAKEQNDHYHFSVRDNGIGIDPKYADKIFLIFQRLVDRHEYEGTGIGLAVSKRIVERHGGNIWFESSKEKGTTFYFTLAKNHEYQIFTNENEKTIVSS